MMKQTGRNPVSILVWIASGILFAAGAFVSVAYGWFVARDPVLTAVALFGTFLATLVLVAVAEALRILHSIRNTVVHGTETFLSMIPPLEEPVSVEPIGLAEEGADAAGADWTPESESPLQEAAAAGTEPIGVLLSDEEEDDLEAPHGTDETPEWPASDEWEEAGVEESAESPEEAGEPGWGGEYGDAGKTGDPSVAGPAAGISAAGLAAAPHILSEPAHPLSGRELARARRKARREDRLEARLARARSGSSVSLLRRVVGGGRGIWMMLFLLGFVVLLLNLVMTYLPGGRLPVLPPLEWLRPGLLAFGTLAGMAACLFLTGLILSEDDRPRWIGFLLFGLAVLSLAGGDAIPDISEALEAWGKGGSPATLLMTDILPQGIRLLFRLLLAAFLFQMIRLQFRDPIPRRMRVFPALVFSVSLPALAASGFLFALEWIDRIGWNPVPLGRPFQSWIDFLFAYLFATDLPFHAFDILLALIWGLFALRIAVLVARRARSYPDGETQPAGQPTASAPLPEEEGEGAEVGSGPNGVSGPPKPPATDFASRMYLALLTDSVMGTRSATNAVIHDALKAGLSLSEIDSLQQKAMDMLNQSESRMP